LTNRKDYFHLDARGNKGGCPRLRGGKLVPLKTGILLNDGTVKFIRTLVLSEVEGKEELHSIRWK